MSKKVYQRLDGVNCPIRAVIDNGDVREAELFDAVGDRISLYTRNDGQPTAIAELTGERARETVIMLSKDATVDMMSFLIQDIPCDELWWEGKDLFGIENTG